MVSVKFFGSARVKFGIKELNVEASDLSSLLKITAGELKVSKRI